MMKKRLNVSIQDPDPEDFPAHDSDSNFIHSKGNPNQWYVKYTFKMYIMNEVQIVQQTLHSTKWDQKTFSKGI